MVAFALPADVALGRVRLRITNLDRSLDFYVNRLGLHVLAQDARGASLAAAPGEAPLVVLHEIPGTKPRPEYAIGLYHFALLFDDRAALGARVRSLLESWGFTGFADHGVSEAAYLADPDGLGIELYADRPRSAWQVHDRRITMYTRPLDLDGLLLEAGAGGAAGPARIRMGHVHLHVSDLDTAGAFYGDVLGFEVTNDSYPGARFFAAGGYHHHVGTNVWARRRADPDTAGLIDWLLHVPDPAAKAALRQRAEPRGHTIEDAGEGWRIADPDGNAVVIA